MNYYPFHIGDYASATRHLSWDEDSAYRRMLDVYYTTEHPLPADLRAVCRLVMAQTDAQREAVKVVLEEFFVSTENGWINQRADAEITAMREKQQKQREKANKRWHKQNTEHGNAPALPQHVECDATASKTDADAMPPTPTPTPISKPNGLEGRNRAAKLPGDFYPNDTGVAYAETRRLPLAVELEQFRNWHTAKGSTMKDWQAAWRAWCDKAVGFGRAGSQLSVLRPTRQEQQFIAAKSIFGGGDRERIIDGVAEHIDRPVAARLG